MEKKDLIAMLVAATTICSGLNIGCNNSNSKSSEKTSGDTLKHIPDPNPAGDYETDSTTNTSPKTKLYNDSTRKEKLSELKHTTKKNTPA
jgi:hypothetical protein